MKVVILGNQARALSNFWTVLIKEIVRAGHEVICLVPAADDGHKAMPLFDSPSSTERNGTFGDSLLPPKKAAHCEERATDPKAEAVAGDPWESELLSTGAHIVHYRLDRKGLNPLRDVHTLRDLYTFFHREKPDLLFASTIKPVIYGAFASAMAGYPKKENRHLMITGLGYMFEANSPIKRALMQVARLLYRLAFSLAGIVYFQNNDDRELFEKLSITPRNMTIRQTKGTGVDLHRFPFLPMPDTDTVRFLLVGRLLEAKGIKEFCEAAHMLVSRYPKAEFCLLGPEETGPGSYPMAEFRKWERKGAVRYLGETRDVRPYLAEASVVVLPSWREGAPCSLMEAMSTGRPVVAADAPGSRDVVVDGENGILTPVRDAAALAKAMETLLLTPSKRIAMGKKAREHMENGFSAEQVAHEIMRNMGLLPGIDRQGNPE